MVQPVAELKLAIRGVRLRLKIFTEVKNSGGEGQRKTH